MVDEAFEILSLVPQNEGAGTNKILKEDLSTVTDILVAGREARTRSQISRQMANYSLRSSSLEKDSPEQWGVRPWTVLLTRASHSIFTMEIVLTALFILTGLL